MTRLLRRLLRTDDEPDYIVRMKQLWRVPASYTLPTTAKVVPPKAEELKLVKGRKAS